jgi:hypothetical protein
LLLPLAGWKSALRIKIALGTFRVLQEALFGILVCTKSLTAE